MRVMLAALVAMVISVPAQAGVLDSLSVEVGAQGAWWDNHRSPCPRGCDDDNAGGSAMRDAEAFGSATLGIVPAISVVADLAYGFSNSYLRGSVGGFLTASDTGRSFWVSIGVARHFRSEDGLFDEWCDAAKIGWRPVASSDLSLGLGTVHGLDTGERLLTLGVAYPLQLTVGK